MGWRGRLALLVVVALSSLLIPAFSALPSDAAEPRGTVPVASTPPSPTPPRPPTRGALPLRTVDRGTVAAPAAATTIRTVRLADGREAVADRVVVVFRAGVGDEGRQDAHQSAARSGAAVKQISAVSRSGVAPSTDVIELARDPSSIESALRAYRADPRVQYAEPDYVASVMETPNDPSFALQWGMTKIGLPTAWNTTHGSSTVPVAVLDCGIFDEASGYVASGDNQLGHPDLRGKVIGDVDFTGSTHGTMDWCGHGTHVAGIIGAATNNGVGVAGVGYNSRLFNVKVLDDAGVGSQSWIASGITWAADHGAKVISMSLAGTGACPTAIQSAIDSVWARGLVVVAAAGNDANSSAHWPAGCNHTLAVASTDQNDARSSFSD